MIVYYDSTFASRSKVELLWSVCVWCEKQDQEGRVKGRSDFFLGSLNGADLNPVIS